MIISDSRLSGDEREGERDGGGGTDLESQVKQTTHTPT